MALRTSRQSLSSSLWTAWRLTTRSSPSTTAGPTSSTRTLAARSARRTPFARSETLTLASTRPVRVRKINNREKNCGNQLEKVISEHWKIKLKIKNLLFCCFTCVHARLCCARSLLIDKSMTIAIISVSGISSYLKLSVTLKQKKKENPFCHFLG